MNFTARDVDVSGHFSFPWSYYLDVADTAAVAENEVVQRELDSAVEDGMGAHHDEAVLYAGS